MGASMRKIIMIILLLIVSGCGFSKFEKEMRLGRDAMHENEYSEALRHFDNALIEDPSNEDAKILYDRAADELDKDRSFEALSKYQEENVSIFTEYMKVWAAVNVESDDSNAEGIDFEETYQVLRSLHKRASALGVKYESYKYIYEANADFTKALEYYRDAFLEAITGKNGQRISDLSSLHEQSMQSYRNKINELKSIYD